MPIFKIYVIVLVLAVVLIGGGIAYYVIRGTDSDTRQSRTADGTGEMEEGTLTESEKKSILESLTYPFTGDEGAADAVPSSSGGGGTSSGAGGTTGGSSGSTGGTKTTGSTQPAGSSAPSSETSTSTGETVSGGSLSEEEKQKILEGLQSGSGSELSEEEKQKILESLQQ